MRSFTSDPVSPSAENVETGICTSYPTPPVSTTAWFGCFSNKVPRRNAIMGLDKFYMARRRFFVDEIQQGRARVLGEEAHHLTRVLRVERGQKYEISDNRAVWLAEVQDARKDLVSFALIEPVAPAEPPVRITLFASLVRFERFEDLIEKATELGVERIVPVVAERSEKGLELAAEN